mmetsp:Transcript_22601/g.49507  ORF Transcript_22601/g.49507 Transcript_22601/m.49507 type:complete len:223 (+) Transcript_22601:465-1133(+)
MAPVARACSTSSGALSNENPGWYVYFSSPFLLSSSRLPAHLPVAFSIGKWGLTSFSKRSQEAGADLLNSPWTSRQIKGRGGNFERIGPDKWNVSAALCSGIQILVTGFEQSLDFNIPTYSSKAKAHRSLWPWAANFSKAWPQASLRCWNGPFMTNFANCWLSPSCLDWAPACTATLGISGASPKHTPGKYVHFSSPLLLSSTRHPAHIPVPWASGRWGRTSL